MLSLPDVCSASVVRSIRRVSAHGTGKALEVAHSRCGQWWSTRTLAPIAFLGCTDEVTHATARAIRRGASDELEALFDLLGQARGAWGRCAFLCGCGGACVLCDDRGIRHDLNGEGAESRA